MAADDKPKRVSKGKEVKLEYDPARGHWFSFLIHPSKGFDNKSIQVFVRTIPPGCHTATHRHGEAIIHVIKGKGYSIIGDERYEWETGDTILIPPHAWHQHFNSDPDNPVIHLAATTGAMLNSLGMNLMEPKGDKPSTNPSYVPDPIWK